MGIKKGNKLKFKRKEQYELIKEGKKGCQDCGRILTLDKFQQQKTANGYRSSCKYCRHVKDSERYGREVMTEFDFYHKVNKEYKGWERLRMKGIQRRFNIPFEEAKVLTETDNCEICGISKKENGKGLAVDHCHTSGKIRGVLCSNCNTGIGMLKDDVNIFKNAIKYINKFKEEHDGH